MNLQRLLAGGLALVVAALGAALATAAEDPALPAYQKRPGVVGTLSSAGSDTLANLMTLWAEAFRRAYPGVTVQVQAAGSSTAPPALIEGTANLGPMSRRMKDSEVQAFEARYGYGPTAVPVAIDALALFVHKDNPIASLTLPQVDAIFSSTRLCGAVQGASHWRDLGIAGELARQPIQLFGRNSVSGTYGYFREAALCKGDYKAAVNEQPGSASVVQAVSTSLNAIGYSGIGYRTSGVRAVPLVDRHGEVQAATEANALSGRYPLARYLFLYVNKAPGAPLPPLEAEFVRLVLSREGQAAVVRDGYVPLPAAVAEQARRELGL